MPVSAPAYLTPPAVARLLGVKPSKVIAWVRSEQLRACDLSERRGRRPRWKISPQALEEFLAGRSNQRPKAAASRRRRKLDVTTTQYF